MMRVLSTVWLALIWVVLWGEADVRALAGGLVVGALLVFGLPGRGHALFDAIRPGPLLSFAVHYTWQVLSANAVVAWEIVTPGSRVREGIVAVPVVGASDAVVSVLAHVIAGTPGTLILDIERGERTVLYVHVLHLRDVEQVRRDILDLERRLIRAIGSRESLDALESAIDEQDPAAPEAGEAP